MTEDLVKQKVELLAQQKAKCERIHELLNGSGGFNEHSRKTLKNLEAAITASKRPGYFHYYEAPEQVKAIVKSGEVERLHEQVLHLQKKIDQLTEKIDSQLQEAHAQAASPGKLTTPSQSHDATAGATSNHHNSPNVTNMKQWFAAYGAPKPPASNEMYSSFTPDKKVYGGTSHYSAFRSQSSTMKKGRLTK